MLTLPTSSVERRCRASRRRSASSTPIRAADKMKPPLPLMTLLLMR